MVIDEDMCAYIKCEHDVKFVFFIFYADDILLAKNDISLKMVLAWSSSNLEMKDWGEANYILGVKILTDLYKKMTTLS